MNTFNSVKCFSKDIVHTIYTNLGAIFLHSSLFKEIVCILGNQFIFSVIVYVSEEEDCDQHEIGI